MYQFNGTYHRKIYRLRKKRTLSIHHFHIDHVAPCLPPPLPPKLRINIVLDFSWDNFNTQDKLETMVL